LLFDAEGRRAR